MSAIDDIMESLKRNNPFDIKNYSRLLELFFESPDSSSFYNAVVTYNKDKGESENTESAYVDLPTSCTSKWLDTWMVVRFGNENFPTKHRFYINSPMGITKKITQEFINECTKQNIPFELKYEVEQTNRNDGIVIGSNSSFLDSHLKVLRKIAKEHPEWTEKCGTPPILTADLDGWIGFADENTQNKYYSYSKSRTNIFVSSIMKFLIDHPEIDPVPKETYDWMKEDLEFEYDVDEKDKTSKEFNDELERNLSNSFRLYSMNEDKKRKFAKYIKENPDTIVKLYELFREECRRCDVDPEYPIFNAGSLENLKKEDMIVE